MKEINFVLRYVLAGVFLFASYDKILHPFEFASIIRDYKIVPESFANIVAVSLPWVELELGVLLIIGRWLEGALFLVNILFFVFWGSLVLNEVRGIDVSCGCFSTTRESSGRMALYIYRDSLLIVLGVSAGFAFTKQKNKLNKVSRRK